MKHALLQLTVLALAGCCSTGTSGYRVVENEGQPVVLLEDDSTVLVRPAAAKTPLLLVGMTEGKLSLIQLNDGGKTPFSVEFTDHSPSRIVIEQQTEDGSSMILDQDGDGIPDFFIKHSGGGAITEGFVRDSIDWKLKEDE